MTEEELEAEIAKHPPDPAFDAAIPYLTDAELELALDDLLTRDQILALARNRGADIKETDK